MDVSAVQQTKVAVDGSIAAGALSSPWWVDAVEKGLGWYVLILGAVLITLRVYIAWQEARKTSRPDD